MRRSIAWWLVGAALVGGCGQSSGGDGSGSASARRFEGTYWKRTRAEADATLVERSSCQIFMAAFHEKNGANAAYDKLVAATEEVMRIPPTAMTRDDVEACGRALLVQHDTNRAVKAAELVAQKAAQQRKHKGSFCRSAKAVPRDLQHLSRGPYRPDVIELDEGWRCLGYFDDRAEPLVAQMEVRVKSETEVEVVARRPAPGGTEAPTEYVVKSWVDRQGMPQKSVEVR